MMEKERKIEEDFFDKLKEFALSCFMETERPYYDASSFERACKEVGNFDIFDKKSLSSKIKSGAIALLYKEEENKIVSACALEVKTGRILFCMALLGYEKYLKDLVLSMEKRMVTKSGSGPYVLFTLAFIGQTKRLERLGFYKVKSEVTICGVKFSLLKYSQEEGDIQNY